VPYPVQASSYKRRTHRAFKSTASRYTPTRTPTYKHPHVLQRELVLPHAHLPVPVHDHARHTLILHPGRDRVHGPGSTRPTTATPNGHGTSICTGAGTSGVYCCVLPRLHVLNYFPIVPGRTCDKSRYHICCVQEIDVTHTTYGNTAPPSTPYHSGIRSMNYLP
jgi:hypothetical protein